MRRFSLLLASISLCVFSLLLSGCSSTFDPMEGSVPPQTAVGTIQGSLYGGQQAIVGAHIYVYAASIKGYGGNGLPALAATNPATNASTSLLTSATGNPADANGNFYVTTGTFGSFVITNDYTCTVGTQVYLYAAGGAPYGGGSPNPGIGLMAILGQCPANQTFSTTVPFVYISEVSTVVAAYAMAGFATDATHVGTSGSSLAKTGIANAFATAANLVNINGNIAYATTPNGNGTVPQFEIHTLANILAACVNTTVANPTQCNTLFSNAKSAGTSGTTPTETATAAINIAHNPTANIGNLYGLQAGVAAPYNQHLTAQPSDFTISIAYSGGGLTPMGTQTFGMASDASGNLWVASNYDSTGVNPGKVLCKFSTLGVPANAGGYGGIGLSTPNALALDINSSHVWIANYDNNNVINFNVAASTAATVGIGAGANPGAVGVDGSGNIWVGDINDGTMIKMSSGGSILFTDTANVTNGLSEITGFGFEPGTTGNAWVANTSGFADLFSNSGTFLSSPQTSAYPDQPYGPAIDSAGNAWFSTANRLYKVSPTGTSASSYTLPATNGTFLVGLAVDGGNNVWTTSNNFNGETSADNAVYEVSNAGVALSGPSGYLSLPNTQANSIAIDISGNVWYTSVNAATLRELVGAAVPTANPISYAVANSLLGARP
jgi:streptogramin lyase